jgi:hypothetical protein
MEVDFNSILGVGFMLWAGVVGVLGTRILTKLDTTAEALQQYIVQTESRLAVIETKLKINL